MGGNGPENWAPINGEHLLTRWSAEGAIMFMGLPAAWEIIEIGRADAIENHDSARALEWDRVRRWVQTFEHALRSNPTYH